MLLFLLLQVSSQTSLECGLEDILSTQPGVEVLFQESALDLIYRDSKGRIQAAQSFDRAVPCETLRQTIFKTIQTWANSAPTIPTPTITPTKKITQESKIHVKVEFTPKDALLRFPNGQKASESPAEFTFNKADDDHLTYELKRATFHPKRGRIDLDAKLVEHKVALEPHGWAFHVHLMDMVNPGNVLTELGVSRRLTEEMWLGLRLRGLRRKDLLDDANIYGLGLLLRHLWMRPDGWFGVQLNYGFTVGYGYERKEINKSIFSSNYGTKYKYGVESFIYMPSLSLHLMISEYFMLIGFETGIGITTIFPMVPTYSVDFLGLRFPW